MTTYETQLGTSVRLTPPRADLNKKLIALRDGC
jgi:hypothetical protein